MAAWVQVRGLKKCVAPKTTTHSRPSTAKCSRETPGKFHRDPHGWRDIPGSFSPTVLGLHRGAPSHVLPTGGAGASFAGLTVDQFQRRTSLVEYSVGALRKAMPFVSKFAEVEGLDAHGRSASIRLQRSGSAAKRSSRVKAAKGRQ